MLHTPSMRFEPEPIDKRWCDSTSQLTGAHAFSHNSLRDGRNIGVSTSTFPRTMPSGGAVLIPTIDMPTTTGQVGAGAPIGHRQPGQVSSGVGKPQQPRPLRTKEIDQS
jgi:hypothetical protein